MHFLFTNFYKKYCSIISSKLSFRTIELICITKLRCCSRIIPKTFVLCKVSSWSMRKNCSSTLFWWLRKSTCDVDEWFTISRFDMHQSWIFSTSLAVISKSFKIRFGSSAKRTKLKFSEVNIKSLIKIYKFMAHLVGLKIVIIRQEEFSILMKSLANLLFNAWSIWLRSIQDGVQLIQLLFLPQASENYQSTSIKTIKVQDHAAAG